MKKCIGSHLIKVWLLAAVLFTACENDDIGPELNVIATPATVNVGETVNFQITGSAESFVIYTGDAGHDYASSYLAIAEGMDVDMESVVLTADSLTSLLPWLQQEIDNFNATAENPLSFEAISTGLQSFVGKSYEYKTVVKYEITDQLMPGLASVAETLVNTYFENNSVILAPEGGYHTGIALNRSELDFSHVYDTPGTYTATVIATNVSNKNYSGSGYKYNRTASASEYDFNRLIRQITITVQ